MDAMEVRRRINAVSLACIERTGKAPKRVHVGPEAMEAVIVSLGVHVRFAGLPVAVSFETPAGPVPVVVRQQLHEAVIADGVNGEPFIEEDDLCIS